MDIRKDKFLASLLAFGVMGATACGGAEEEAAEPEAAPMTAGGTETMAEPEPMGMEEEPMAEEPPMEEPAAVGAEEEDLGPTPE